MLTTTRPRQHQWLVGKSLLQLFQERPHPDEIICVSMEDVEDVEQQRKQQQQQQQSQHKHLPNFAH